MQSVCSSIGMNLCLNEKFSSKFNSSKEDLMRIVPVILSSISLCHDIGNPPFGHFGEKAICSFFHEYFVTGKIFNKSGQKIIELFSEYKDAGPHIVQWDGNNANGLKVSSGTYFYRLTVDGISRTMKMLFIK